MVGLLLAAALAQPGILITGVTVINGRDSLPQPSMTVVVEGRHITAVRRSGSQAVAIHPDARRIDGRGKYLIPGLWDMHVHLAVPGARDVLPLYLKNGVTGVRDMGGDWAELSALRVQVRSGALAGPRMLTSGPYLEGNPQPIPHLRVRSPDEALAAVDSLTRLGVDLVKLHTGLSGESYFAALRAAGARGLPTAGHVPRTIGARTASDSGLGSIEHLLGIPLPCTPAESIALAPRFEVQAALGRCSSAPLEPLVATLVRNRTAVVPTFTAQYEIALWPGRKLPGDRYARHLPDTLRRYVAAIFPMPDSIPPNAGRTGKAVFAKRLAQVGALHRAGVMILPGTDAPLRNSPPGFGLHQELEWLAKAGLSNWAVLKAATLDVATFMGLADSLGTIEAGKLADLVLLDANPLDDIRNTRRIRTVILNGRGIRTNGKVDSDLRRDRPAGRHGRQ
ncbi:MAG: amidohydrolase family protein [Gemmatimonadales bacterium]